MESHNFCWCGQQLLCQYIKQLCLVVILATQSLPQLILQHMMNSNWTVLPHAVTTCCSCGTHYSTSVESKSLVVMWINTLPTPEKIHLGTDCATAMVLGTLHQERGADNMCWLDWLHLLCTSGSSQWWRYWTIQYTTHALWRHSRMVSVYIPFVWHKLVFIYVIII